MFLWGVIEAHVCLLLPEPRGGEVDRFRIRNPACGLLRAPCGGVPRGAMATNWTVGQNVTVLFQARMYLHCHCDYVGRLIVGGVMMLLLSVVCVLLVR